MQVKKQQLEPDMEQQTGSKLGKEYIKDAYCHPAYLTYITLWHVSFERVSFSACVWTKKGADLVTPETRAVLARGQVKARLDHLHIDK